MKHNVVYNIKAGVIKKDRTGEFAENTLNMHEDTYKPSVMSNKKLLSQICFSSYKHCMSCENIGYCEYGNEAVRRKLKHA